MIKYFTLILAILFGAPNLAHSGFYCSGDAKRDGILYRDGASRSHELVNLRFEKTPFLPSYLACANLLEHMPTDWNLTTRLTELYPPSRGVVRFSEQDPLIDLCLSVPACQVPLIENFFNPRAVIGSLRKPSVLRGHPECFQKDSVSAPGIDAIKKTHINLSDRISFQSTWKIPEMDLQTKIFDLLDHEKPKRVFFSSMILSRSILTRLDEWLLNHPGTEAWALFAYNLHVMENDFPFGYQPKSKNLHLFPVFQTPFAEESFHIKGIALEGNRYSTLLMTVNIRRFQEEKVADRIFQLAGKESFNSFAAILSQVLDEQCSQIELLKCSNLLRYGKKSGKADLIESWVRDGCRSRFRFESDPPHSDLFSRGRFTQLESDLIEKIKTSKKTILVSSHIFHQSAISDALLDATSRGVQVKLLVGTQMDNPKFYDHIREPLKLKLVTKDTGITSHAKFMIFDDDLVVWGTGNFTANSMDNPWEIFLGTRDPRFRAELKAYFDTYYPLLH